MTELNQVIVEFETNISSVRIEVTDFMFSKFVDGSPELVLQAIQDQVNKALDEYGSLLINVLEQFKEAIQENQRGQCISTCRKERCKCPEDTR